jgi:hypothetical protein
LGIKIIYIYIKEKEKYIYIFLKKKIGVAPTTPWPKWGGW